MSVSDEPADSPGLDHFELIYFTFIVGGPMQNQQTQVMV